MILPHIYDVDISQPLLPTILQPMMVTGDKLANRIGVRMKNGNQDYTPDGSCRGYVLRADGATVPILDGVVNGNEMYIDLPEAAYAVQGSVVISIVCVTSTAITTVFLGSGTVNRSQTDVVIDPGTVIDDISTLIQAIETAVASIPQDYSVLSANMNALTHFDLPDSGYISGTGAEVANSDYRRTGYIPVASDSVLILDGFYVGSTSGSAYAYYFYAADKTPISGANGITSRTVVDTIPSGAAYVRFSSRTSQGETPVAYVSNHVAQDVADLQLVIDSELRPNDMAIRAAAAPNYGTWIFPVAAGDYAWYNGVLRKAKQDIATAEDWTAAHWDTAVIGEDITDLKSAVGAVYTATAEDEGKALKAKTVSGGKVTEWEFGAAGGGLTADQKTALLACFEHVAWIDEHGQDYYDALEAALNPTATLTSISAVYTQSGTVYTTDSLDSLKPDLVVTATYDDSTTEVVTAYTLSGTLTEGTSTITVTYGGKTDTFSVTVSVIYKFDGGAQWQGWIDNNAVHGVNASQLDLVAGWSVSGGAENSSAMPKAAVGRATSRTQIIIGVSDGQTVTLSSYTLSSGAEVTFSIWYGYIDDTDNTFNSTQYISRTGNYIATVWHASSVVLPTNTTKIGTRFLEIGFKKGDGSSDFTAEELAELPTLIQIQ